MCSYRLAARFRVDASGRLTQAIEHLTSALRKRENDALVNYHLGTAPPGERRFADAAGWRWLLDRDDSPWYPIAHLSRQKRPGDRDGVVADVVRAVDSIKQFPVQART